MILNAVFGSVTGSPCASLTQPGGSGLPFSSYTLILLLATVEVAMSRRNGALRRAGAAKAIGFVPSTGTAARVGTTAMERVALVTMPTRPSFDAIAAAAPK